MRTIMLAACTLVLSVGVVNAQANFDGTYRAPAGGVTGNSACGTTRFGYPLRVSGSVASLQTVSQGELQGRVGPDGSISIQHGPANLSGRIAGSQFTGTYTVNRCVFTLNYTK